MLSVILCTWNRCDSLRDTLNSFERLSVPADLPWELLVVDNNSTDATSQVIDEFDGRLPIRKVFEPRAGKSHALNTAVGLASGEYLVFTDDDVLVGPDWLCAYRDGFARHPQATVFGGPIEPLFQGEQTPAWLKSGFAVVANAFAIIDRSAAVGAISHEAYPYGANMALHRRVFNEHRYPVEVGPRPGSKVRGEEMMLIWELLSAGESGFWIPDAVVEHSIPPRRQTMAYLREYYLGSGELMDLLSESDAPQWLGRPRWAWRQAIEEQLRYLATRYTAPASVWLQHYRSACIARGLLSGFKPADSQTASE